MTGREGKEDAREIREERRHFEPAPQNWSDVKAVVVLVGTFLAWVIGGVSWGLKLESRIDVLARISEENRQATARGILPLTEERLGIINQRISELSASVRQLEEAYREFPKRGPYGK